MSTKSLVLFTNFTCKTFYTRNEKADRPKKVLLLLYLHNVSNFIHITQLLQFGRGISEMVPNLNGMKAVFLLFKITNELRALEVVHLPMGTTTKEVRFYC